MATISGDKPRGITSRIKDAIKRPEIRASIQASVGYFFLLSILSAPSIWLSLSLSTCLIGPIYALVSFNVVLQTNVGTALNWVVQRITFAALAGALGLCCIYITYAANGSTYLPSVTKAAVMTTFTSILGFIIIMCGYRWQKFWFGFIVASLTLPVVALSGFHLPYVEPLTMPYFLMNVCIGVTMAALVSMFVLPITAGSTIRATSSSCLLLLGQGTKELMEILLKEPVQQQQQGKQQQQDHKLNASSSSSSSPGEEAGTAINLTGFIESWTNPVSIALVKAKALLVPVATEVDIYHRPVLFPRYAYGCLLDLLRYYMSTLMTLVYLVQGEAPLGAVRSLNTLIIPVVEQIEHCLSTAAQILESSGRGGGVLDTDDKKAALLYVEGLNKLTALEDALRILSTNHINIPFLPCTTTSSASTTASCDERKIPTPSAVAAATVKNSQNSNNAATYTEGEIVMADTVIAIIFALGSRVRRLYFVLPETLSHQDSRVWEAWRGHYKGQKWDFDVDEAMRSSSSRQESFSNGNNSRDYAEMGSDVSRKKISFDESCGASPSPLAVKTPPLSSPFSSAPLERQVSEVKSPFTLHRLATFFPSLPTKKIRKDEKLGSASNALDRVDDNVVHQQQPPQSSSSSFFSRIQQRWNNLPRLVDINLPYGFTGEGLVLSLQVGIALAAATVVHVCSASYEALNENTIWLVMTVAVLAQKSIGGLVLRGGNRVAGTTMAGILGLGVIYFVYLINGLSYINRVSKFIFMTLILSILAGILMWGSTKAPIQYGYAWFVCKLTLPIICLVGYSGETPLPKTALWRLCNVSIGLGIDLVVTSLVFPQSTKGAVERRVSKVLDDLAAISLATKNNILPARSEGLNFNMSRTSSMPLEWQSSPMFLSHQSQEQNLKEIKEKDIPQQQEEVEMEVLGRPSGSGCAARGEEDKDTTNIPLSTKNNLHIRITTPTPPPRSSSPKAVDNPATLSSSSPSFYISSPRHHQSKKIFRKNRSRWLKQVALGKPVLQLRPLGQDAASLLVAISEFEVIASFEERMIFSNFKFFSRGNDKKNQAAENFAGKIPIVRRSLRRMLNALLSFVYVLDGPDVPHLTLLLQHRQEIDAVMVQLSDCLVAIRTVASHTKVTKLTLDRLSTTQTNLLAGMQGLIDKVETVPPPLGCTHADVVLGFAGLGVLIAAVQTLGEVSDAVINMFASPANDLEENTSAAGGEGFPSASSSATSLANNASSSSSTREVHTQQAGNMKWSKSAKVLLGGSAVGGAAAGGKVDRDEDMEVGLAQGFRHGD